MPQWITSTQFYLFGRWHFTRTGWEKASAKYVQGEIEDAKLNGKVFLVTGSNSGIGRECAQYLYERGAKVYVLCRNLERANKARTEMMQKGKTETGSLEVLIGDVSLAKDTMRVAEEFKSKELKLDGLVCNAGALQNEKTMTAEGVEITFASHLAFGSYLLSRELRPLLEKAQDPRCIFVTSGGAYNSNFPGVNKCIDPPKEKYDGQFAYVYAKRGQILLAEALSAESKSKITYVSSHPGWTSTPAVDLAYGEKKKYLEPMRTTFQGAEGMIWLCCIPTSKLQSGALYLDRSPQRKHLAGPFFTEGSATKNTPQQVNDMLSDLEALCQSKLSSSSS
uniref:Ketoreductase domain-containing protein n=1 Tax=Aureoumbra lagunensis TaxID=44058 RepID=A0A7S3NII1_9STRA|mmetsp:Transcript_16578/g.21596  ORF Transcript_16578/g.21596 Transcript_16578/m.21596 type:complete len:336 (-) Transcript_16578:386-1393(-)